MIWDDFFREKITKIFQEKNDVLDIGGGLRISRDKSNRFDKTRAWILPLIKEGQYKVMDPVPDYHPDLIGDIHALPLADESRDAIICIAVLEHVENPLQAVEEIYRVLKPGGYCFIYVPFLYYYHPERGYYNDYWRFTADCIDYIFKKFSSLEKQSVRGAIGTWLHISPLGKIKSLVYIADYLDRVTGKIDSQQVSGYNIFLIK